MTPQTPCRRRVEVDRALSLADAQAIAEGRDLLVLTPAARRRCAAAEARLRTAIEENRHIYGVTTGFGPLANRLIAAGDGVTLQQNLVHHLATGLPPALGWAEARAVVLARLMSILQGLSGASEAVIDLLVAVLASDLAPEIPSRGSVGASGDLTPLAHMVLALQGRAAFLRPDGARVPGPQALARIGAAPLSLARRDGLALVNGTSAMTGLALLSARDAARAVAWAERLSAAFAEVLGGRAEAWDPAFAEARPHPGQRATTGALAGAIAGSGRLVRTPLAARCLPPGAETVEAVAGQDAYTVRCVPQVIGAVRDTLLWHDAVVARELCSATDNPLLPPGGPVPALHGGNFMGCHVALASDALSNAVLVLAGLAERQVARLTDETLNRGLPPFLAVGPAGLNSGLMGAQVTASACLAEMRATGGPASVQSISTNGANQDVVSMGTIAARLLRVRLGHLREILAILALAVAQGIELRRAEVGTDVGAGVEAGQGAFSPAAEALLRFVRRESAALTGDRPLSEDIGRLAERLARHDPPPVPVPRAGPGREAAAVL